MSGTTGTDIKRRTPRRPYVVTADGLRRIVLGAEARGAAPTAAPIVAQPTGKPLRPRREPVEWHVAVIQAERGDLDGHAREAVAAAAILARPETGVLAIILGPFSGCVADLGADAALVLSEAGDRYDPEHDAERVAAIVVRYRAKHIFLPDKPDADGDLGRRLGVALSAETAAHVVELSGTHAAVRWSGGTSVARAGLPRVVLLAPGAVDARLPFAGAGEILSPEELSASQPDARIRDLGLVALGAEGVPLEEADLIVSAGNGVADMAALNRLAGTLGAAVGASRVAVDEGKCARHQQIGATGKTVAATTYIAVGISGAVQHLMGIKDCRHVIAINRDAGAPIAGRADLTVVGDAGEIVPALLDEIERRRRRNDPEAAR